MRIIAGLLLLSATALAERIWIDAKVQSVEYENTNPVGPLGNKAVKYLLSMPDGSNLVAYHVSSSAYSGFRKDLSEAGKTAKVSIKNKSLYVLDAAGKTHHLHIHKMSKRPQ